LVCSSIDSSSFIHLTPTPGGVGILKKTLPWPNEIVKRHPKSPIRDRDDKHGPLILHLTKSTGIKLTKTPIRAPRANTICERFSCLLSPGVNVFCLLPILHLGYVNITLMNSINHPNEY